MRREGGHSVRDRPVCLFGDHCRTDAGPRLSSWSAAAAAARVCARTCTAGEQRRLGPSARVCTMGSTAGPGLSSNAPMGCEMPHASRPDIDEQWRWRWRFASHHASASVGGRVGWPDASMVGRRGQYVFARSVSGGGWLARKGERLCCNQTFPGETTGMVRLGQGARSEMEGRA